MESPPDLETVYQAVYSLYNNSNPSGPGKISQWLDELQKSVSYLLTVFYNYYIFLNFYILQIFLPLMI